jgi:Uma2 family endonuclease
MDTTSAVALERETILAQGVSFEDYLNGKYGVHTEWIDGVVIAMSPVSAQHDSLARFLDDLLGWYLELTDGGRVLREPMVMKPTPDSPAREPDLQVLRADRLHLLKENLVAGAANLVVEIVSPESFTRDRGVKFEEYERGGVDEYWVIDPKRREALFYVRDAEGVYQPCPVQDGVYASSVLPGLRFAVAVLWQQPLPSKRATLELVEACLRGA